MKINTHLFSALLAISLLSSCGGGGGGSGAASVDNDRDKDGVLNINDAFPDDPSEFLDSDQDGVGNNADLDDDNDGISDTAEASAGTSPILADTDGDGVTDDLDTFPLDATNGFEYELNGDSVTVTGCSGTCPTDLVIPNTIAGKSVTSIGYGAFNSNQLTSVIIPGSVASIGAEAFYNNQLTSVTIGDSVTNIGEYAFYYNKLTSVTIPDSVTSIGRYAFYENKLTSVTIGDSVTSIGEYAFRSNQLTSVIIPDSVTSIGYRAFQNNQLTSVTLGDSVTSIGGHAFVFNQLTEITFLGDRPALDTDSFHTMSNLSSITYCEGQAGWPGDSIHSGGALIIPTSVICNAGTNEDTDVNGIWLGTTSNSEYGSSDTYGLFYDGEFVALNVHFNEFYKGTYSIDQDDVSATGKGYALNGPYGGTGSINGVASSQGTLLATVEASIGTTSNLSLAYSSDLYERSISFADLEGSWSGSVIGLSYNISIDSSGYFTAVASDGCTASGNLDIPNPSRNMIKVDLSISGVNCTVTGNYSGLGILADDGTMNDSIVFGYANDNNGFAYIAYRSTTNGGTTDGSTDGGTTNEDTDVNGIWLGTTSNSEYGSSDTYGLFYDGEFVALNVQFNEFYKGTYSIDQDDVSATGKGYALNGPYGGTGSINGVASSQGTLLATVEASIGTTSNLSLAYSSDLYERSISFADLEGSWSGSVIGLSYNISIDSSGYFTAVASDGCTASGNLDIPNPSRNMIKVDLSISGVNCTVTGNYSGLGILADDGTMNDSIVFGYANDDHGFAYIAYRN